MRVAVIGAGSWGSALAVLAVRRRAETVLVARDDEVARLLETDRRHPRRHAGYVFPEALRATTDIDAVLAADIVVLAVPSAAVRETLERVARLSSGAVLVSAVKGFEISTGRRVSEVAAEFLPSTAFAVLSGPTFAEGVLRGDPSAAVVASADPRAAERVQQTLSGPDFRLYRSDDVLGVEISGGMKNVVAIAAGIVSGLGLGHNTLAALVTRGLAEIARLVLALGGKQKTLLGLAGVGDLMLTCTGDLSRNRRLGEAIGRGTEPSAAIAGSSEVAEGSLACLAAVRLAESAGTDLPITEAVRRVLYEGLSPRIAIQELMGRGLKAE
jgi:glycerol-3-phosphate dehydrogenase (NAD(P)+)